MIDILKWVYEKSPEDSLFLGHPGYRNIETDEWVSYEVFQQKLKERMEIIVLGLQRSGTNYIENLLRKNFKGVDVIVGSTKYAWKHGLPNEKYIFDQNTSNIQNISKNKPIVFLIRKKYELWLESLNRYKADFGFKIKHLPDNPRIGLLENPNKEPLKQFHKRWYDEWVNELEKNDIQYIFIEYIDLIKDYEKVLTSVSNELKLENKSNFVDIQKVYQSNPYNQQKKDEYIKKYNSLK